MWFKEISKDSDVVISSRVRYARNIQGYKFPHLLTQEESNKIVDKVDKAIDKTKYHLFQFKDIDEITKSSLMEQRLISKEFLNNTNGAMIANKDNTIVTMINEEDHFRIQSFQSGFQIDQCYANLKAFTKELNAKLPFAISKQYGYITSCPTNIGSGLRVSVMLHLPALYKVGLLSKLFDQMSTIGIAIRGLYGENTNANGCIFQVSNQKTLGITDEDIISNIEGVITTIIEQERKARNLLLKSDISLEDEIFRAYGILQNARIMSDEEAIKLLSKLRLGISIGIIKNVDLGKIQGLMVDVEPNTLQLLLKENLTKTEEEIKRAKYIREELK